MMNEMGFIFFPNNELLLSMSGRRLVNMIILKNR